MHTEAVKELFLRTGGLLEGHFVYASGRHGRHFLQAARVLQYPDHTSALCEAMAQPFAEARVDLVAGPATGGIILAYETARALGCRAVFTEKEADGSMALKRGFHLKPGTRTLAVEDITTTGGSVRKTIEHLAARGANIVGVACLVDRSGGAVNFSAPFHPLAQFTLESWPAEECPLCAAGEPTSEPDDLIVT